MTRWSAHRASNADTEPFPTVSAVLASTRPPTTLSEMYCSVPKQGADASAETAVALSDDRQRKCIAELLQVRRGGGGERE